MTSQQLAAPKAIIDDRSWPVPSRSWLMRMKWHDLAFFHWPVEARQLQSLLPSGVPVDEFDGQAWIGVVPFWMSGVGVRWTPNLPFFSTFPELNVRTYVTIDNKPGVWFFSLDATNPIAVRGARQLFNLPYMDAKISVNRKDNWIVYDSERTHRNEPAAELRCEYRPVGEAYEADQGTLLHWLTARYCMYMASRSGQIFRGEIDHSPWKLRDAQAIFKSNTMTDWLDLQLPDCEPLCHFAQKTNVIAWSKEKVQSDPDF